MKKALLDEIVAQMSEVLSSQNRSRGQRDTLLNELARDGFDALFPEGISRIPTEEVLKRWDELYESLALNPNRDKIMRVMETLANGEGFDWLD